jgi:hypothetical protein
MAVDHVRQNQSRKESRSQRWTRMWSLTQGRNQPLARPFYGVSLIPRVSSALQYVEVGVVDGEA